jgi:hypothetical protein
MEEATAEREGLSPEPVSGPRVQIVSGRPTVWDLVAADVRTGHDALIAALVPGSDTSLATPPIDEARAAATERYPRPRS